MSTRPARAWVLLKSGKRLDLLDPHPMAWDDADLATGLSRTYRWCGHSKWDLPLSVAQHSITVLLLSIAAAPRPLTAGERLRELAGLPFFFLKTDIAGNVMKRSSATRFQFAWIGGPCPLWSVYRAFAAPGQLHVQLAGTPDGATYLNVARTVGRSGGYHLARPRAVAAVLGCEAAHATQIVYAAGFDLQDSRTAVPIGPGCRLCERTDCRHRAVPPVGHKLDVGTREQGLVPYKVR